MNHPHDADEPPSDICLFSTREVYDFLRVPCSLIPLLEHHIQASYATAAFPNTFFSDIPLAHIASAVASLDAIITPLIPSVIPRARWFAEWALWRAHTAPIPAPPSGIARTPGQVYALMRVSDAMRSTVLSCTSAVYKTAGLPDMRFTRIPEDVLGPVVLQLKESLAEKVPDMRRGEDWFARWALGRRHKSRARGRNRV